MVRFFKAVFFKLYALAKRTGNKEESEAMFTAVVALTCFTSLNLISIIIYFECVMWHTDKFSTSKILQLSIAVIIGVVIYFLFMNKNRYEKLYKEYKADKLYNGKRGTILAIIYILFSFCFLASLIWVNC